MYIMCLSIPSDPIENQNFALMIIEICKFQNHNVKFKLLNTDCQNAIFDMSQGRSNININNAVNKIFHNDQNLCTEIINIIKKTTKMKNLPKHMNERLKNENPNNYWDAKTILMDLLNVFILTNLMIKNIEKNVARFESEHLSGFNFAKKIDDLWFDLYHINQHISHNLGFDKLKEVCPVRPLNQPNYPCSIENVTQFVNSYNYTKIIPFNFMNDIRKEINERTDNETETYDKKYDKICEILNKFGSFE